MISHPEKILFPDDGITKGELASYYARVAPVMLPHIRRRPVTMERYHRGIGAPGFFQKDVSKGFPEWLKRVEVPKNEGGVNLPLLTPPGIPFWSPNRTASRFMFGPLAGRILKSQNPLRFLISIHPATLLTNVNWTCCAVRRWTCAHC